MKAEINILGRHLRPTHLSQNAGSSGYATPAPSASLPRVAAPVRPDSAATGATDARQKVAVPA